MKSLTILMPSVSSCSVTQCAYNAKRQCHARAITVGDGVNPACDTYLCLDDPNAPHVKEDKSLAGVGACKVSACIHNLYYECMAEQIEVRHRADGIHCTTFSSH